ncbi:MAG: type II toxin-antitoxin system Phd/YefM family antitoxin [Armatimonadetes bacterium]|nr:type II toxin-antitoxin system Phd/YefM family antitoxin [Armatimonadota bacterium]
MSKPARRITATEVKAHFGRIMEEVSSTGSPVIVHSRHQDRAVIISLVDFRRLWPMVEFPAASERERVKSALHKAGLLRTLPSAVRKRVGEYDRQHTPEEQQRLLAELRSLRFDPPLSQIIQENRRSRLDSDLAAER